MTSATDVFAGGEVGRDLARVDWAATPLGSPESWPPSLRTVVRTMLGSRFSMWMAWGPDLTFFCNDAYRRDTLGTKYPWALGRPSREVWAEIWPDISPRIDTVLRTGTATWDEALMLFLERSGYPEETYHTFSYSPLTDDEGRIAGMLCVVAEETDRVIGEQRMATLRELGAETSAVRTETDLLALVRRHLAANPKVLPFTLTYLFDDDAETARLAVTTGVPDGHAVAPAHLDSRQGEPLWPVAPLARGTSVTVDGIRERVPDLPTGFWATPPAQARVVPLPQKGHDRPYGFLVVGLNPLRPFDTAYRGFVDLVAAQVASALAGARAYEEERRRAEQLAELDRAKTTFFTNVSHEFRTPLTLLLGPAEDALADAETPLPPVQRERVEVVHRNAQRLLKLVNTLLDFSRLESGRITARYEPTELASYTAELASSFRSAVERAGLTLTVDCPPMGTDAHVDRDMWAKVVLNLLSNALKFTFHGGVTVRMREGSALVDDDGTPAAVLTVEDTGEGIPVEEQDRLFERFHRVTGARSRSHEGSGIGLALVAELAALHGGTVGVRSVSDAGSTFTVRIPLGSAHLPADQVVDPRTATTPQVGREVEGYVVEALRWIDGDEDGAGLPEAPTPTVEDDRARVLVVDDNADMRAYVTRLLAPRYRVELAPDGQAALEQVHADPPDLVLTDVMMPRLDGFGLIEALRASPDTANLPVVMLSARAGDEATVEGLESGADDYLVKPFAARELVARVRSNLELDRARRGRESLERQQDLLDETQRLSRVGSWQIDLVTGQISGSDEFLRQLHMTHDELLATGLDEGIDMLVHPEDRERVRTALHAGAQGHAVDVELRLVTPDGTTRTYRTLGTPEHDAHGTPVRLRGSNQDVTDQREAERTLAAAAAEREAAQREHRVADELQRSLLPSPAFTPDHLTVATYYRAGVEGTHVGGDWYDVVELGAGRTALVVGDVMGRGVRAAAVMGQLRAAVRAYARLDLPPADVLEFLDGVVRDLGDDQIVTCVYAVYDPGERSLTYANAGHVPPLLAEAGNPARRLTDAADPPLGSGPLSLTEETVALPVGAVLALYTDGLVEHRYGDLDDGIDRLATHLGAEAGPLPGKPDALVSRMLARDPDDDVAVLLAQVHDDARRARSATWRVTPDERDVHRVREDVSATLTGWSTPDGLVDDVVLLVSELVTNALVHGRPPIELRLRSGSEHVVLDVRDGATYLPRRLRPTPEDEHGRGLQLVSLLADRWGTRPTQEGKSVWCVFSLARTGDDAALWQVDLDAFEV